MDVILFGSFSHVTIEWIQEPDVVLFGSPSHVTMVLKWIHVQRVGAGILIKESSIKVIELEKLD